LYDYKKECTRLAAASDKVYQLFAHGRWFSTGTPASSTTKTGRHDIAEILLKVVLNNKNFKKNQSITLWKIVGNSLCNFCKLDEDYSHYFITCTFLKEFWTKFQNLMKGLGIENKITLKHIVLGYKIDDKNYLYNLNTISI
jgi:hypothetical protein